MRADLLHVVVPYANPVRWNSRLRVHKEFEEHMLDSGVKLTTVECAYGERPFELPDNPYINRVRARSKTLLWNKEACINLGVSRVPEAKYIAWVDGDVYFRKNNWATEAVHALQQYDIIQPWSDAYDLGPNDEHVQAHKSFCRLLWQDKPVVPTGPKFWTFDGGYYDYSHTGFAWAATRQTLEWLGGLIEFAIMGSGDHHMALSLIGEAWRSVPAHITMGYMRPLLHWQERALLHVNRNIGFTWGTIEHKWHGRKKQRAYQERWAIIEQNNYDPDHDLKRNTYGLPELAGNKPRLAHDLDKYFRSRNEDTNTLE